MLKRLECIDTFNNHFKFWEAELDDEAASLTVRWGRIGRVAQTKTYHYSIPTKASQEFWKKVNEKLRKSYREVIQTSPADTSSEVSSQPTPAEKGHRSLSGWMTL